MTAGSKTKERKWKRINFKKIHVPFVLACSWFVKGGLLHKNSKKRKYATMTSSCLSFKTWEKSNREEQATKPEMLVVTSETQSGKGYALVQRLGLEVFVLYLMLMNGFVFVVHGDEIIMKNVPCRWIIWILHFPWGLCDVKWPSNAVLFSEFVGGIANSVASVSFKCWAKCDT